MNLSFSLFRHFALLMGALFCLMAVIPAQAFADDPGFTIPASIAPGAACTLTQQALPAACDPTTGVCPDFQPASCTDSLLNDDAFQASVTILSDIVGAIKTILGNISKLFYENVISKLKGAMAAMFVLYIVVYGIMIMFQMVPLALGEIVPRVFKIAVVLALFSGWDVFNAYIGTPVIDTIDTLISAFMAISLDNVQVPGHFTDFGTTVASTTLSPSSSRIVAVLQSPFQFLLTGKFFIMFWAMLFSSFSGFFISIILARTFYTLVKVVIAGLFTYLRAVIVLFFLFGIAPVFILFIVFEETRKKLFQGWLNQVLAIMIQPIIYFAFIAFFFVLINATLQNIMDNFHACEVQTKDQSNSVTDSWRPSQRNPVTHEWEAYSGDWANHPPVDMMSVFLVWLLVELTWRFSKYVDQLGTNMTGGAINTTVRIMGRGAKDVNNFVKSFK